MKDLAIWLGKYTGVTYTCTACLEEYDTCALNKTAHSNASQLGKQLHEMAKSKDHLHHQKRQLATSMQLNAELSVLAPTNQLSVTVSSTVARPPCNVKGSPTGMQLAPAPYDNDDIHMRDASDDATAKLYGE